MAFFLPFTPNGKATELQAIEVKRRLQFGAAEAIDPVAILPRIPARLVGAREIWVANPELAQRLFVEEGNGWSGIGLGTSPADGVQLILLNPAHATTRRKASLMEEIVHLVLDHPKTTIVCGNGTATARSYDGDVEDEAFNVGAACLLPYPALFRSIRDNHETALTIAEREGLSEQCVEYRIKRAGLSHVYRKHCGPLEARPRRGRRVQ